MYVYFADNKKVQTHEPAPLTIAPHLSSTISVLRRDISIR